MAYPTKRSIREVRTDVEWDYRPDEDRQKPWKATFLAIGHTERAGTEREIWKKGRHPITVCGLDPKRFEATAPSGNGLKQLNVSIEGDVFTTVEALARDNGWSKKEVVERSVRTLADLLERLPMALENFDDDIRDFFRQVIRDRPSRFIELTEELKFGHVGEWPAMRLPDGWWVYSAGQGELRGVHEETGEAALVVDGELKVIKLPTPEEISRN